MDLEARVDLESSLAPEGMVSEDSVVYSLYRRRTDFQGESWRIALYSFKIN